VFKTEVSLQIDGLARREKCSVRHLSFPTAEFRYASGSVYGGSRRGCIAMTKDGGQTWTVVAPEAFTQHVQKTHFWSAEKGLATLWDSKTLITSDGGATWIPAVATLGGEHALYAAHDPFVIVVVMNKSLIQRTAAAASAPVHSRYQPTRAACISRTRRMATSSITGWSFATGSCRWTIRSPA
jgi:hypothetical protein